MGIVVNEILSKQLQSEKVLSVWSANRDKNNIEKYFSSYAS